MLRASDPLTTEDSKSGIENSDGQTGTPTRQPTVVITDQAIDLREETDAVAATMAVAATTLTPRRALSAIRLRIVR